MFGDIVKTVDKNYEYYAIEIGYLKKEIDTLYRETESDIISSEVTEGYIDLKFDNLSRYGLPLISLPLNREGREEFFKEYYEKSKEYVLYQPIANMTRISAISRYQEPFLNKELLSNYVMTNMLGDKLTEEVCLDTTYLEETKKRLREVHASYYTVLSEDAEVGKLYYSRGYIMVYLGNNIVVMLTYLSSINSLLRALDILKENINKETFLSDYLEQNSSLQRVVKMKSLGDLKITVKQTLPSAYKSLGLHKSLDIVYR